MPSKCVNCCCVSWSEEACQLQGNRVTAVSSTSEAFTNLVVVASDLPICLSVKPGAVLHFLGQDMLPVSVWSCSTQTKTLPPMNEISSSLWNFFFLISSLRDSLGSGNNDIEGSDFNCAAAEIAEVVVRAAKAEITYIWSVRHGGWGSKKDSQTDVSSGYIMRTLEP